MPAALPDAGNDHLTSAKPAVAGLVGYIAIITLGGAAIARPIDTVEILPSA